MKRNKSEYFKNKMKYQTGTTKDKIAMHSKKKKKKPAIPCGQFRAPNQLRGDCCEH
tara:strand:- start:874 stop:1041 length:168 start_codon:yes stop_codon:yes gene_type:complete